MRWEGVRGLVYLDSVPSGGEVVFGLFPRESGPGGHSPRTPGGQGKGVGPSFTFCLCSEMWPWSGRVLVLTPRGHRVASRVQRDTTEAVGRLGLCRSPRGGGEGQPRGRQGARTASLGRCSLGGHLSPCLLAARIHFRCCESRFSPLAPTILACPLSDRRGRRAASRRDLSVWPLCFCL